MRLWSASMPPPSKIKKYKFKNEFPLLNRYAQY